MSVLASLARAYDRLPDAPPFGYSTEKIGFLVSLNDDGSVAHVIDLRSEGRKPQPRPMLVPGAGLHRTPAVAPKAMSSPLKEVVGPAGVPVANRNAASAYWIWTPAPNTRAGVTW